MTQKVLNKLSLLGQNRKSFTNYKLVCFQPNPYRQFPSPDLESNQPAVQRPNRRPCRHPVQTTPTTSTYQTDDLAYDQPTADNQYQTNDRPVNYLSSIDQYVIRSINLHPFSCYTVALRLSLHCLGCSD